MTTYSELVKSFRAKNSKPKTGWRYESWSNPDVERIGMKPGGLVEPGVTHYATEYLSNEEFSSLYKKFKGTDKEFAEFLNKEGYKAKADRKFTADSVYSRRDRLGLESKGYVRPTMKDFKKEAKALGIDIKGLDDETIKRKVEIKEEAKLKK